MLPLAAVIIVVMVMKTSKQELLHVVHTARGIFHRIRDSRLRGFFLDS
jgi:hypothetical protein